METVASENGELGNETFFWITMFLVTIAASILAIRVHAGEPAGPAELALRSVDYLGNYDGDTLRVHVPNVHALLADIPVRVNGVDTPEMNGSGPCEKERAREARAFTEKFLRGARRIDVVVTGRDKYWRVLGDVLADGKSLGPALLERRLAVPYDGKAKPVSEWCPK